MFEIWTGHLLLAEKVVRPHQRAVRLISNSRVTESQGDNIRHCCQFIGSLLRSLAHLPKGGSPGSHPASKGPIVAVSGISVGLSSRPRDRLTSVPRSRSL